MEFYTDSASLAGGFILFFTSTPRYQLRSCTRGGTNFPALPTTLVKDWKITLTKSLGIRLVIHCNEIEILNVLVSDTTCEDSSWKNVWNRDVDKIRFFEDDTASDYYRGMVA